MSVSVNQGEAVVEEVSIHDIEELLSEQYEVVEVLQDGSIRILVTHKDVDKISTREDALSKAFEFEKATLGFYKAIKEILGENTEYEMAH